MMGSSPNDHSAIKNTWLSTMRLVRWRMFSFMFGFGFFAYIQQKSLTVAAEPMMPQLGLSQMQIGWLQQAFIVGYLLLQLPAGVFGQRKGARYTLVLVGVASFFATVATPIAPYLFAGQPLFELLLLLQLLLGLAQAAIFPVSAGVFEAWFPPSRWAFVEGLQTAGLGLGAALAPPLIASLMTRIGWQQALIWTSLPAAIMVAGWAWYGRNSPAEHPSVSAAELADLPPLASTHADANISFARLCQLLTNRNVLLITLAYGLMNYVFYLLSNWCFLYLVQARHFSVLESGWLASLPPLLSAAGALGGGILTGNLSTRLGARWGYRLMPLVVLPIAGALLLLTVVSQNSYAAIGALTLCFGFIELSEGAFWGGAMSIGRQDCMIVCGVMNAGAVIGGLIGTPIVAYLSGHGQWNLAFLIGIGFVLASSACWLGIDASAPLDTSVRAHSAH